VRIHVKIIRFRQTAKILGSSVRNVALGRDYIIEALHLLQKYKVGGSLLVGEKFPYTHANFRTKRKGDN
jgi:hypothetical protein